MSSPLPRVARWIIASAGLLVPSHRRDEWRRQWEAEVVHRVRAGGRPTRFVVGAFAHAFYLRREAGMMRGFLGDVRQSVRALARKPAFSVLTVLTLAIGIGTASAVYSLAEVVLFRTLPLPGSDALVEVVSTHPVRGWDRLSVSYPDFVDFSSRTDLFESASFYRGVERDLSGGGEPQRLYVMEVHEGFFETTRSETLLGRTLSSSDQEPDAPATVVLAEALWRSRFGADPGIVGTDVRLDGVPHTVVGVLRSRHELPVRGRAWVPLRFGATPPSWVDERMNHTWQVVARLTPGVDAGHAGDQVRAMATAFYADFEDERDRGMAADVLPFRAGQVSSGERNLFAVMGLAVFFVLVIASMNASGLMMSHLSSRARELSLRTALGAGRHRIVAQLLSESLILALVAGALGVTLAVVGVRQLLLLGPPGMAETMDVQVNGAVLAGAVGLSLAATLFSGLVPALRASRASAGDALKEGTAQSGTGRSGQRLRNGLVMAEVALSVMLLTGAGLTIRSFQSQLAADPGFDTEGVMTFTVRLPSSRYEGEEELLAYYGEAVRRLTALPGVEAASSTSSLPLGVSNNNLYRAFIFEGQPRPPEGVDYGARWVEADAEYFGALGARAVRGRVIGPDDRADTEPVILVNEAMADRLDDSTELLGRRIRSHYDEDLLRTIVGIVPDIQMDGTVGQPQPAVYVPASQSPRRSMAFLVRASAEPAALLPALRRTMAELDGDVALDGIRTLDESHRMELGGIRFIMSLFGAFGLMALVLAVSGVYGQVAYSVTRRTREFGIRMAVGATAGGVQGRVVGEGLRLAGIGLAAGALLALGFARLLSFALFGLPWLDVTTFVAVGVTLSLAALVASWVPARRATRVDPVAALRTE